MNASRIILILALIAVAFAIYLFVLARLSQSGAAPGLADGRLSPCPDRPNCVCSEFPQHTAHFIAALPMTHESEAEMVTELEAAITSLGGKILNSEDAYLSASFTSTLFGFVDDVEFRVDAANGLVQVRSASRVGHSDLGANRERVERIRQQLAGN